MALQFKEDQTAPISKEQVLSAISSDQPASKIAIVEKILSTLKEKRDSYSGILASILHVIDSNDVGLIEALSRALIDCIVSKPMPYSGRMFLNKVLNRLTSEKPIFVLDLFEQVILTANDWSVNFEEEREILKIQIVSIKAIRRAEHLDGGRETLLSEELIDQLCDSAIHKCDDSTKIDTLTLILESRSTTKPLDERRLELFKVLMLDAIRLQEPALRQIFIAQTNKLINRIIGSHRVVMRDVKLYSDEFRHTLNLRYKSFLEWLITFCLDSIYCNAYFGSFVLTISTLKLLTKHITYSDENLSIEKLLNQRRCYDSVLCCLNDSFEDNKAQALDLILSLPYNEEFICEKNLTVFETIAYELVESVNPAHSLTCQYVFKLIIGLRSRQVCNLKTKNQLLYKHLMTLINIVEEGVRETNDNFAVALKIKPIYPKLTCIRALLDEIEMNDLEENREQWKTLAKRLVSISIDACSAVSTIVCNLNPETIGHLPMDLNPVDIDALTTTLNDSLNLSNVDLNTITSQMLLISGWKTIKECSLSLGSICRHFWWPPKPIPKDKFPGLKTDPILNSEDIIRIIDFFDHYLKNLRHRGAFEQAYNGFLMVTRRVWHDEQFKKLLVGTLEQIINDFKLDENVDSKRADCLKAYVTRRSAGLPFIVQAILNSEHKHDSQTLRWVLDQLFEVLENKNSEVYQRIHCLNILRALIKEHALGEKVLLYIGKTFTITMESSRSDSFPIRNCANMLLKAAVDRTFGVNRLRDDIHRRNQLSFERFFKECPQLHSDMIRHLKDGLSDRRCLATIHYVFVVLFRLRTTLACDKLYDYEKIIKPFIEPILAIVYQCPDYKLREIASKLVVRLERFCDNEEICKQREMYYREEFSNCYMLSQTTQGRHKLQNDQNRLHGILVLLRCWIESLAEDDGCLARYDFIGFARNIVEELSSDPSSTCSIMSAILDLVEASCIQEPQRTSNWFLEKAGWQFYHFINEKESIQEPHFETFVFKALTMSLISLPKVSGCMHEKNCLKEQIIGKLIDITHNNDNIYSLSLGGSLIRFLRQILFYPESHFIDDLLNQLDMDLTAAHPTIIDRRNSMSDNDPEKWKITSYLSDLNLLQSLRKIIHLPDIVNLSQIEEVKSFKSSRPILSNTARCIEHFALAIRYYSISEHQDEADFKLISQDSEYMAKVSNLTEFTSLLPNCDLKCVALLLVGTLIKGSRKYRPKDNEDPKLEYLWSELLNKFSKIVEELTDGSCSLTLRSTCAEVLRLNIRDLVQKKIKGHQKTMVRLFSALVKLCQDEDSEVRSSSQNILISLRECSPESGNDDYVSGSRLDDLIRLMTLKVFDPNELEDINHCVELLLRFIFNNSKDYTCFIAEDKESLFDKTKLNTFVDYVATIRSSLSGLEMFFDRREKNLALVELNSLTLPCDIEYELKVADHSMKNDTGDYSWRKNMLNNMYQVNDAEANSSLPLPETFSNEQLMDKFIENLAASLNYFRDGYRQLLLDAEYTYHELALYRKIAVVKFIFQCTSHKLKNTHLIRNIQDQLEQISRNSCTTTLLLKCSILMRDIRLD